MRKYVYNPNAHVPRNVRNVIIPNGITEIKEEAFDGRTYLKTITIPDSVTRIGRWAFFRCLSLQSITIPDSVTSIEHGVLDSCSSLQSITISNSVTNIGDSAFYGCSSLQSITIPDSVTNIGESAFNGCSSIRSIVIPDNVTNIGEGAFHRCSSLRSITIPNSVISIGSAAFYGCSSLCSVVIPNSVTKIGNGAFKDCGHLSSLIFKGIDILPFINIDGYGVDTFDVIKALIDHGISLNEYAVKFGIEMAHQHKLDEWAREYPIFGEMRLPPTIKTINMEDMESLRRNFAAQTKTKGHVPKILRELAIMVHACRIPPERLAKTFDIKYTKDIIADRTPIIPAETCRCYYDRSTCDALIQKGKASVMAEAISLYNTSQQKSCYKHLMDFIASHMDTKTEDLVYAVDHTEEIPVMANTTLTQIRQHREHMENLAEVNKIETKYEKHIPGFRLSNYSCSIEQTKITYNGITARVLDLSNPEDIALATRLGELTRCRQCLGRVGETAMMHGFMNPNAGFWVIENNDGKVKAQAEIWESDKNTLVFDNIKFANMDSSGMKERIEQIRNVIAAWAMDAGYKNIIMGCGYNELGIHSMKKAPIPKLRLTPEEVFVFQKDNDADMTFKDIKDAKAYMRSLKYKPTKFVYTDANKRCVYIKKNGKVSNYLMQGYDYSLVGSHIASRKVVSERESDSVYK